MYVNMKVYKTIVLTVRLMFVDNSMVHTHIISLHGYSKQQSEIC